MKKLFTAVMLVALGFASPAGACSIEGVYNALCANITSRTTSLGTMDFQSWNGCDAGIVVHEGTLRNGKAFRQTFYYEVGSDNSVTLFNTAGHSMVPQYQGLRSGNTMIQLHQVPTARNAAGYAEACTAVALPD